MLLLSAPVSSFKIIYYNFYSFRSPDEPQPWKPTTRREMEMERNKKRCERCQEMPRCKTFGKCDQCRIYCKDIDSVPQQPIISEPINDTELESAETTETPQCRICKAAPLCKRLGICTQCARFCEGDSDVGAITTTVTPEITTIPTPDITTIPTMMQDSEAVLEPNNTAAYLCQRCKSSTICKDFGICEVCKRICVESLEDEPNTIGVPLTTNAPPTTTELSNDVVTELVGTGRLVFSDSVKNKALDLMSEIRKTLLVRPQTETEDDEPNNESQQDTEDDLNDESQQETGENKPSTQPEEEIEDQESNDIPLPEINNNEPSANTEVPETGDGDIESNDIPTGVTASEPIVGSIFLENFRESSTQAPILTTTMRLRDRTSQNQKNMISFVVNNEKEAVNTTVGLPGTAVRYYTVGAFRPGLKMNVLLKLLNIQRTDNIEKLIVIAKTRSQRVTDDAGPPIIIDISKLFSNQSSIEVNKADGNRIDGADIELTDMLDKELQKALDKKKATSGDTHLTPEEIDDIIEQVTSMVSFQYLL